MQSQKAATAYGRTAGISLYVMQRLPTINAYLTKKLLFDYILQNYCCTTMTHRTENIFQINMVSTWVLCFWFLCKRRTKMETSDRFPKRDACQRCVIKLRMGVLFCKWKRQWLCFDFASSIIPRIFVLGQSYLLIILKLPACSLKQNSLLQ